jgi:hypothetical protein
MTIQDTSLRELVAKIMPVAIAFRNVSSFIESHSSFKYGLVSHALCAAVRELQKEYLVLIAQLEHQAHIDSTFSLQKLWFYIGPSMNTLESLAGLLSVVSAMEKEDSMNDMGMPFMKKSFGGGKILNIIYDRLKALGGYVFHLAHQKLKAYITKIATGRAKKSTSFYSQNLWCHIQRCSENGCSMVKFVIPTTNS